MATKTNVQKIVSVKALAELNEFGLGSRKAQLAAESAGSHLVRAAIISRGAFKATVDAWYESIRKDANGIAVRLGADRNKEGTGFVVPNSLRVQVSQVLRAMDLGVKLGTEAQPRGMGEIRKATTEAAEAKAAAEPQPELTGDEAIKAAIVTALSDATAEALKAEGDTLKALAEATTVYAAAVLDILAKAGKVAAAKPAPEAQPETAQPMPEAAAAKPKGRGRKVA